MVFRFDNWAPFRLVDRVLYEDHFLIFAAVSVPAAAADDDDEGVADVGVVHRKTRLFRPDAVVSAFPIGTIGCHRTDKSRKKPVASRFRTPDFKFEVFRQLEAKVNAKICD